MSINPTSTKESEMANSSKTVWLCIKEILADEEIVFNELENVFIVEPKSLRWKQFFIRNCSFWAYSGKEQKQMITLSAGIDNVSKLENVKDYVSSINQLKFSVYFTDYTKDIETVKKISKEYIVIVQPKQKIEEFTSTFLTKLFFIKKGYLVGEFEIPIECGEVYGSPDIVGIKGDFVNELKNNGFIFDGADESDLLIWPYLKQNPYKEKVEEAAETIACEIKSSDAWNKAFQQLYFRDSDTTKPGYLKSKCFNEGYACFGKLSEDNVNIPTKYEAGYLIFTNGTPAVKFKKDLISNSSNNRRANSVQVQKIAQQALISKINKNIARKMASSSNIKKLIPSVEIMSLNEVQNAINELRVKNIINSN